MNFEAISLNDFCWLNEPKEWKLSNNVLTVKTNAKTDFWQDPFKKLFGSNGHFFRLQVKEDFRLQACVEAKYETLYDQAGVMIYSDDKHWIKAGIEYNDGHSMISSVVTNDISDWATGLYTGNPAKFWIKLSKVNDVVCIKYSMDKNKWYLLRLAPFSASAVYVGVMCCTPQREGLDVKFSELSMSKPAGDVLSE
ncbi:regulation of enolase protein 1-like [Aricia agestis]|uniref:regulation of enolase protein 1-like n=1 Tax=Aricia agestis TaxID=91739 RepID=UPI001C20C391|nr:regulation of enolase protein 1-like [Aricia agestis]